MKILYLNYMGTSLPTLIRSFELARATSQQGHDVTLAFMSRHFRPPAFFLDVLAAARGPRFDIRYRVAAAPAPAPVATPAVNLARAGRPSLKGLVKQMAGSLRYLPEEARLIAEVRPDVLVARPDHVMSFSLSAWRYGLPLVLETDGPVEELDHYWGIESRWVRPFDTARAHRAQALLVISEVCAELWRKKGVPASQLFPCPNGADPEVFRPQPAEKRQELRRRLGIDDCAVIGFSGNQRAWHGVDGLLKAAVPILRERSHTRLLIIGALQEASVLGTDTLPVEVKQRIVFSGPVPYAEMPAMIDAADVMALPYPALPLFHFSPMKMFEALSVGKPIVASRQGQIDEFLTGLESAYLYEPGNGGALEDALRRALADVAAGRTGEPSRHLLGSAHTWAERGRIVAAACEHARQAAGAVHRARVS